MTHGIVVIAARWLCS